jgi:hypothetical protein
VEISKYEMKPTVEVMSDYRNQRCEISWVLNISEEASHHKDGDVDNYVISRKLLSRCYARGTAIPGPVLGNGSVNTFPQQQRRTHQELYFLCGPCRDVIRKGQGQLRVKSYKQICEDFVGADEFSRGGC